MIDSGLPLKVGYVVKMFPRLSETFILNEMLELEARGIEVVVFSMKKPNEGKFHPQISKLNAEVLYLEDLDIKKWGSWLSKEWEYLADDSHKLWELLDKTLLTGNTQLIEKIWYSAWIAAQAKKRGLDRLHAHFASMPSTLAYLAHQIIGIPYSFTAHAKDIFVYSLDEHLLREKLVTAQPVVTVTHFNHRFLKGELPECDKNVKVVHNGIDIMSFLPDKSITRLDNQILSVGRLVPKKGFHTLLDACAILREKGISFECKIVGGGPEEEALLQQKDSLGFGDEVIFTGPKTVDEVLKMMKVASIFCLPCTVATDGNQDALPTVLLEALACGLPVISTNVSGIPEIVDHNENGILIGPEDPHVLADQLIRLLKSSDLRVEFAGKGRGKALAEFDIRKQVGRLIAAWEEALKVDSGKGNQVATSLGKATS